MSAMTLRGAAVLGLGALGVFGCTTTLGGDVSATPTAATAARPADSPAPTQKERLEAAYTGPKKRIAVAKFDAIGAFIAQYGGYDLGGGLAAQLATELVKTGRFIVVERIDLAGVLREQELAATKLVSRETAAQLGQVLGAQLLVRGSVTEFEAKAGGGGLRLGGSLPLFGAAIGGATQTAHVGIDLRLIDTTSGQVVQATRAEAQARESGVTADVTKSLVSGGKFDIGAEAFQKTPLGQATREAIDRAVRIVIAQMEALPWTGHVVDFSDGKVYINAGGEANIRVGDRFVVFRTSKRLTDPATGTVLGQLEDRLGEIVVEAVQPKFAVARVDGSVTPRRGDLVKIPQ